MDDAEVDFMRFGSWNVGSALGKAEELVEVMTRGEEDECCFQERRREGRKWSKNLKKGKLEQNHQFVGYGCPAGLCGVHVIILMKLIYSKVSVSRA